MDIYVPVNTPKQNRIKIKSNPLPALLSHKACFFHYSGSNTHPYPVCGAVFSYTQFNGKCSCTSTYETHEHYVMRVNVKILHTHAHHVSNEYFRVVQNNH